MLKIKGLALGVVALFFTLSSLAASISGTVVDSVSSAPVEDIEVQFFHAASGELVTSTRTDLAGAYTSGNLQAGDYRVRYSDPGTHAPGFYVPTYSGTTTDSFCLGTAYSLTATTHIVVDQSLDFSDPVKVVLRDFFISGQVTAGDLAIPIEGIVVEVRDGLSGLRIDQPEGSIQTATDGSYVLDLLGVQETAALKLRFVDPSGAYLPEYAGTEPPADDFCVAQGYTSSKQVNATLDTALAQSIVIEDTVLVQEVSIDDAPTISGDRVLFVSNRVGDLDIREVVVPGVSNPVANGPGNQFDVRLDGDRAVWVDDASGQQEIFYFDPTIGFARNISESIERDNQPDLSEGFVVFAALRGGESQIRAWDATLDLDFPLPATPGSDARPSIDGLRVAWINIDAFAGTSRLVTTEIGSTTVEVLDSTSPIDSPSVSGTRIAYLANNDVRVVDVTTGEISPITSNGIEKGRVVLSGEWLYWSELVGLSFDIFAFNLTTGTRYTIAAAPYDEFLSDADGQSVVYTQNELGVPNVNRIDFVINEAPVAEAGADQPITFAGETITFDGSQSFDPQGDAFTFSWTLLQAPLASSTVLTGTDSATPSFVADVLGTYVARLTVTDTQGNSAEDMVTASFNNLPPVADAGISRSAVVGELVTLDGSASFDPNDPVGLNPLNYQWSLATPAGSLATLNTPNAVTTTFLPDVAGLYQAELVVNDGELNSAPDTVEIEVIIQPTTVTDSVAEVQVAVAALDTGTLRNARLQSTLNNKLNAVLRTIETGDYVSARDKLANDILGKTDGCATQGSPQGNDWVKDCAAQAVLYPLITNTIALLDALIGD